LNEPATFEMTKLTLLKSVFQRVAPWPNPPGHLAFSTAFDIQQSGGFSEDGDMARIMLRFWTPEGVGLPFNIEAEFGALFAMSRPVLPEERDYYIRRAFPPVIFPYLSRHVAELTARAGFPELLIEMPPSLAPGENSARPRREPDDETGLPH
jgi:hypothetical protein